MASSPALVVAHRRGWTCTRAAEQAAAATVRSWLAALGEERTGALRDDLAPVARPVAAPDVVIRSHPPRPWVTT